MCVTTYVLGFRVIRGNRKKELADSGQRRKIIDGADTREGRWG